MKTWGVSYLNKVSSLDNSRKNKCILETYLQVACFELRAVTSASILVGRTNTQLIILCPQTDSIFLDSNDDEEIMAAPVNTGQLIYCSELILAHKKTFTELTSPIMIGMKLKIIKAPIYAKTPFILCFFNRPK